MSNKLNVLCIQCPQYCEFCCNCMKYKVAFGHILSKMSSPDSIYFIKITNFIIPFIIIV